MNSGSDHLLRIESGEYSGNLDDSLPGIQIIAVKMFDDHYKDIIHILTTGYELEGFSTTQKKQLIVKVANF